MELISRKELLEKLENKEIVRLDKNGLCDIDEVLSIVRYGVPTIDAEPVRHGHWIYNKDTGEIRCNLCNALVGVTMYPDDVELITEVENFCFNCGAKMDEVSERWNKEKS